MNRNQPPATRNFKKNKKDNVPRSYAGEQKGQWPLCRSNNEWNYPLNKKANLLGKGGRGCGEGKVNRRGIWKRSYRDRDQSIYRIKGCLKMSKCEWASDSEWVFKKTPLLLWDEAWRDTAYSILHRYLHLDLPVNECRWWGTFKRAPLSTSPDVHGWGSPWRSLARRRPPKNEI